MSNYSKGKSENECNAASGQRETFRKKNNYEVYNYNFCLNCVNFMANIKNRRYSGYCKLMDQAGDYPAVESDASCDKFLSFNGLDINNEPVPPEEWPEWVRIKERYGKKNENYLLESDLRTRAIENLITDGLINLIGASPEKICELLKEYTANNQQGGNEWAM